MRLRLSTYLKKQIAKSLARVFGWKILGSLPQDIEKIVLIGAPHTSNWDFFTMLSIAWFNGLNICWLGKESLFSNQMKRRFFQFMGGIKVIRNRKDDAVQTIVTSLMAKKGKISLVIAPDGSRSRKDGWRSGFFYIAKQAHIPIGLGYINYQNRTMGIGPILDDLSDIDQCMQIIQDFYQDKVGRFPENQSPTKLINS